MIAHIQKLYLTVNEEGLYVEFIKKIFASHSRSLHRIYVAIFDIEADIQRGKRLALTNGKGTLKYIVIFHHTIPT